MSTENITLTNPLNHELVGKVLNKIGTSVTLNIDADDYADYRFNDAKSSLGIIGDDSIGAVVGAYMDDEDELILVANYGDDGNYHYNVNTSKHLEILELIEL